LPDPSRTNKIKLSSTSLSSTIKVPDLNKLKTSVNTTPIVKEEQKVEEKEEEPVHHEAVSNEKLNLFWKTFADKKRSEGFTYEYTILNQEVELIEDLTVQVKLSNPLQEDILERFKPELMKYLRTSLKNSQLRLKAILVQETEQKMIYTPQEKFNYLAQKQPLLRDLQKRMMLDTDF
jgi:DNA polymerase III subunit gamma/tau